MVGDALIRYLEGHPLRLADTARLFAELHAAMTDSLIQCWRLKRDVGFWRPSQAIQVPPVTATRRRSPTPRGRRWSRTRRTPTT